MSGWICSYRKIWDHPIFSGSAHRVGVWHWMLHKAAWKDTRFNVGGKMIDVKRGQLCVSQRQMEAETGMGRQALRTFLGLLEAEGAITQIVTGKATQRRTIITVCNYEEYQAREAASSPSANPPATRQQPNKEQVNNKTTSPDGEDAAAPPTEPGGEVVVVSASTQAVWKVGKPILAAMGVRDPGRMIGKWIKEAGPPAVLFAIEAAQQAGTRDPIPYITEVLKGENHVHPRNAPASRRPENRPDPALEQIARLAGLGETSGYGGG
ncbi:hypothetical protein [Phaeobacter inhibens]|uniref:hypothetical protein n=1 Tax=Phaeobacter inhibens TaxID=221822 RepID=UPI000C99C861|nr:hypothetical protein [Phaeobacter inhibens]AUQ64419.1 hypothetical protein PhaeoP51_03488 [Phaeobacter inhibens]